MVLTRYSCMGKISFRAKISLKETITETKHRFLVIKKNSVPRKSLIASLTEQVLKISWLVLTSVISRKR